MSKAAGWLVFAVAMIVYYLSAERVGSLWDCGEFITGAYKFEVVHPPGAPLFLLIGRMFTIPAELFSDNPANISFAVNLMSGVCTAFAAAFFAWSTSMFARLALVGRREDLSVGEDIAVAGAGLVAGLAGAFATSVWFSAVEGEVYAMSTFFSALVVWAATKWYSIPDDKDPKVDRWLVFAVFAAGLSIGVHLLSLLAFPAIAMLYYFKRNDNPQWWGAIIAAIFGFWVFSSVVQSSIITGIPELWQGMELAFVNGIGLPFNSGLLGVLFVVGGFIATFVLYGKGKIDKLLFLLLFFGIGVIKTFVSDQFSAVGFGKGILIYGVLAGLMYLLIDRNQLTKKFIYLFGICYFLVTIGFSTIGVIVIRANANTPINMNEPSDPMRLLPYINREQYGERELLRGPWYGAQPNGNDLEDRYGKVGDRYEVVDNKITYTWNKKDIGLFPRMQDTQESRKGIYTNYWRGGKTGKPSLFENIGFTLRYQMGWMYWRYFAWNFIGRQNGEQGFYPRDVKSGHWMSGITPIDEGRLYNQSELPETMKNHKARNFYYFLPLLLGLLGLIWHLKRRPNDALALLALFVITGLGIIIYSNQPPNEPRERDYVLVGSFLTYCMWIGMSVPAIYRLLVGRVNLGGMPAAGVGTALAIVAPLLMLTQNFDDHSRAEHKGSRDYAANFLNSVEEDGIMFTYGDNDTYPLWYAQETEEIRTDVRIVNLSLIAVDWYIEQQRRAVNESKPLNLTISKESYRGRNRNIVPINEQKTEMSFQEAWQFINRDLTAGRDVDSRTPKSYLPTRRIYIPVDKQKVLANGVVKPEDADKIVDRIYITLPKGKQYLYKDEIAILDVIGSNISNWDRPVYFAVTCRPEKMFGLTSYMQMEGLSLRIVPIKSDNVDRRVYGEVYGAGRVATDEVYDNIMNNWAWGNFDDENLDLFIDRSYGPSIQSMRVAFMRTGEAMLAEGDTTRAVQLIDKYFESFPHNNFPYDLNTMYVANIYLDANALENAKPKLRILAQEIADYKDFFDSLEASVRDDENFGFGTEIKRWRSAEALLLRAMNDKYRNDTAFKSEIEGILGQ